MLRPVVQPAELSVPNSKKSVALPFTLSVALSFAIALLPSIEAIAASRPGVDQASTRFILGGTHEAHASDFETWIERRDRGVVKQSLDYSCGIAALATLLGMSFDTDVSESSLLALLEENANQWQLANDWRERGVSLAILSQLAAHYNLSAIGVSVSAAGLMQLQKPAIAFIDYRGSPHFTVIKPPLVNSRIELADPSWGNRMLTRWQFLPMFLTGGHGKLLLVGRR